MFLNKDIFDKDFCQLLICFGLGTIMFVMAFLFALIIWWVSNG